MACLLIAVKLPLNYFLITGISATRHPTPGTMTMHEDDNNPMKACIQKLTILLGTITGILLLTGPAWATQTHGQPEGLYVHQMAHLFFIISMGILEFWLRQRNLTDERGWKYIQLAAVLFIIWNIDAALVHFMEEHLDILGISRVDFWNLKIDNTQGQNSITLVYYFLKLDHLLCVPAMFCLYYGLKTILKKSESADGKGTGA